MTFLAISRWFGAIILPTFGFQVPRIMNPQHLGSEYIYSTNNPTSTPMTKYGYATGRGKVKIEGCRVKQQSLEGCASFND